MKPLATIVLLLAQLGAAGLAQGQAPRPASDPEESARAILSASVQALAEPAKAREALARSILQDPSSPLTEIAARAWLETRHPDPDPRAGAGQLLELLTLEGLHGLARRVLLEAAAGDAAASGNLERWKALHPARWEPSRYLALGPLGDFATDQHGVPFAPETVGIDLEKPVAGTHGPVRWRPLTRPWNQSELEPWQGLKDGRGAWYLLFQFQSREDRPAWLCLAPRGSIEVCWNQARVVDIHAPSQPVVDRLLVPVALQAGWNRLLLKLTETGTTRPSIALVDAQGLPLEALVEEAELFLHPLPTGSAPPVDPFLDARMLLERETGPWASLLHGKLLQEAGLSSAGLSRAEFHWTNHPESLTPLWRVQFALRLQEASHLPADLRRNRSRPILEETAAGDGPAALLARLRLAEMLLQDDRGEQTVRMAQELLAEYPSLLPAERLLHAAYRRLGWEGEELRQLKRLEQLAPRSPDPLVRQALRLSSLGDPNRAYRLIQRALLLDQADASLLSRARHMALSLGLLDEAERHLELETRLAPHPELLLGEAARIAAYRGDTERALGLLEELSRRQPLESAWPEKASDLLLLAGRKQEARALLQRCLELEPSRFNVRRRLAAMDGRDWGDALAAYRVDIQDSLAAFRMRESYAESRSALVVDHMVLQVFEDGSWINEIHQLRRINDLQGVDDYGNVRPQGDIVRLRAFLPDGTVSEPINVMGSYEIPGLQPGAFIEELYRDYGWDARRQPWENVHFIFSSFEEPFIWTRLIVILPERRRGELRWGGGLPAPVIEEIEGGSIWTFETRDSPRVVVERNMPFEREVIPWVLYGEDRPLEEAGREMRERLLRRLSGSLEIDRETARVISGLEGDEAKLRALYGFVQHHVPDRSGSPDPTSILLKHEGERWFLLAAMLRSAGIPAELGLAHPVAPGTEEEPAPLFQNTASLFDWFQIPVLRVDLSEGRPTWFAAGAPRHLPLGMIPAGMAGASVLLLRAGAPSLDHLPELDLVERTPFTADGTIRLAKEREASGTFTLLFPGHLGWRIKTHLAQATGDQRERFVRGQITPLFRGAVLRSFELEGLDLPEAPLKVRLRLRYPNFLQREGGRPAIPTGIIPADLGEKLDRPARAWPFVFREYEVMRWRVTIDPGPSWRIAEIPRASMILHPILSWNLNFRREGNVLRIERDLALRPGRLSAHDYPGFLSLCRSVDEAESRRLILAPRAQP